MRDRDLRIVVGAIEVLSGNFEIFDSDKTLEEMGLLAHAPKTTSTTATRWRMRRPISLDGVAASGTLPEVLPAQVIARGCFPTCDPGTPSTRDGYYWDGLYSQNPPVRDLLDAPERTTSPTRSGWSASIRRSSAGVADDSASTTSATGRTTSPATSRSTRNSTTS